MSATGGRKDDLRENVLERVDALFSLVNTLPLNVQEEALAKIKEKLKNKTNKVAENTYSFECEENNTACTPGPFSEELDENSFKSRDITGELQGSFCKLQNCSSPVALKQCKVKLNLINGENAKSQKPTSIQNKGILQEQTCQYSESCRHGEKLDNIHNASSGKRRAKKPKRQKDLVCTICSQLFHSQASFKIHINEHSENFSDNCDTCKKSFSQQSSLGSHIQQSKCPKCSYCSVTKSNVEKHTATSTKQRCYTCNICDKSYFTNGKLKDHVNNVHHKTIREVCEKCGFATHSKDIMRRHHIVKHTNQETFQCPVCNATIKQKGTFLIHMRIHTGERPCLCKVCSKTFRSRSQLASHMRMHREGEFICETCGHRFRSRSHLQRHDVIHTGAKPFSCHLCSYQCNVRTNITKHVRSVHGQARFTLKKLPPKSTSEETDTTASERGLIAAKECLKKLSDEQGSEITVQELKQKEAKTQDAAESRQNAKVSVDKMEEAEYSSSVAGSPECSPSKNIVSSPLNEGLLHSSKEKAKNASRDILLDAMKLLTSVSADDEPTLNEESFLAESDQSFEIDSSAADNLYVIQVFYNETASNSL